MEEKLQKLSISQPEYSWNRYKPEGNPPPPCRYSTAVLYNGKMYVFGGLAATKKPIDTIYELDFDSKKWTTIEVSGEIPPGRCGHTSTIYKNVMYVFGGSTDSKYSAMDDFYAFDFTSKTWSKIEKQEDSVWPAPRFHHSAVLHGDSLYVFGGCENMSNHKNDLFEYSFESKKWIKHEAADSPSPRGGHLTFEFDGKVYIYGGFSGKGSYDPLTDMYFYSVEGKKWEEVDCSGSLPFTARALVAIKDEKRGLIYTYGGYDGKVPLRGLIEYHPSEKYWVTAKLWLDLDEDSMGSSAVGTNKGMEPTPRYGHSMVIQDSIITVFGGSGSTYLNDVIQFDVEPEE